MTGRKKPSDEQVKQFRAYQAKYYQQNYKTIMVRFHKEKDAKYLEILSRLPKGEVMNYIRELIESDILRTESLADRYIRYHSSDEEAKEYLETHNSWETFYQPIGFKKVGYRLGKNRHFTHSLFLDCEKASECEELKFDDFEEGKITIERRKGRPVKNRNADEDK